MHKSLFVATVCVLACIAGLAILARPESKPPETSPAVPIEGTKTDELPVNDVAVLMSDLVDKRFRSMELRERGLGMNGVVGGRWFVTFEENRVRWDYSDVRESGTYSVQPSGVIDVAMGGLVRGTEVEGFYHKAAALLGRHLV